MIYIFTGPSLPAEEARAELEAVYLPPVAMGDVYRAALDGPRAIGIIDGYFERVPAVWHKEILWAMAEGIHVYGSASMGALRAMELERFGMVGVGRVFEAFQRGELEDDDEVTITHAPPEDGYRPLSEAMVNIRATLASAREAGVITEPLRQRLERLAKELYYPERSHAAMLARAVRDGVPAARLEPLRAWLPKGRVNQKREDALAMLRRMREELAANPEPKRVRYTFEHTDTWEAARQEAERLRTETDPARGDSDPEGLLEELRVSGTFLQARQGGLARALLLERSRSLGRKAGDDVVKGSVEAFRRERGLLQADSIQRWLSEQHIEDAEGFFREEEAVRWMEERLESQALLHLPDHLRSAGTYGGLVERARRKARALASIGLENPRLSQVGLTEPELWRWYFVERLGQPVPDDLHPYAVRMGFEDVDGLRRVALRELCFLRLEEKAHPDGSPTPSRKERG